MIKVYTLKEEDKLNLDRVLYKDNITKEITNITLAFITPLETKEIDFTYFYDCYRPLEIEMRIIARDSITILPNTLPSAIIMKNLLNSELEELRIENIGNSIFVHKYCKYFNFNTSRLDTTIYKIT